ncbi:hypothetical protein AAF712_010521 [Marasmius tenuissimus]|uniref:Uncharacterized protein n=1 Tax=Marasmius tenuissimus TaxID=585030 RepID=A0ABR2ZN35_9AGAR
MVFTRASRSDETVMRDMKTAADTQITFQVPEIPEEQPIEQQDFHLEMPPTPYLQYTPLFPASNSTSLSDMPTPDGTFSDSYSSITGPLTPTGIGLGLSGLTRKDGTPLDSFGLAGFSSSPWRASPQAESESLPSQKFLNEILYTFTQESDTSRDPVRRKVALTRNLSAPTASQPLPRPKAAAQQSENATSCAMIVVPSGPLPVSSFSFDIEVNYAFTQQLIRDSPDQEVQASFYDPFPDFPNTGPTYLVGGSVSTSNRTGEELGDLIAAWRGIDVPGDLVPFWHVNDSACSLPSE